MADKKIPQLDPVDTASVTLSTAKIEIADSSLSAPTSREMTLFQLKTKFGGGGALTRVPFYYAASTVHNLSAGVTSYDVEAQGSGGGGGDDAIAGGAGAGGYAFAANVPGAPGDAITITIPAGGAANAPDGDTPAATTVKDALLATVCSADGGVGGKTAAGESDGGDGLVGDILVKGGQGVGGLTAATDWVLGGAPPRGGQGATYKSGAGSGDPSPGGGGAGPANGGKGYVIIWEYQP